MSIQGDRQGWHYFQELMISTNSLHWVSHLYSAVYSNSSKVHLEVAQGYLLCTVKEAQDGLLLKRKFHTKPGGKTNINMSLVLDIRAWKCREREMYGKKTRIRLQCNLCVTVSSNSISTDEEYFGCQSKFTRGL